MEDLRPTAPEVGFLPASASGDVTLVDGLTALVNEVYAVAFATAVPGNHELLNGLSANASVRYTALAHPGAWETARDSFAPGPKDHFQSSCEGCSGTSFPVNSRANP